VTFAGVVGAALVLCENVDIRRVAPGLGAPTAMSADPATPAPPTRDVRGFDAVVFDSPRNRAFYPDPDFYPDAVNAWRSLVADVGGSARTVSDLSGLQGMDASELLVIPEAPCLSDDEIDAIQAHLEAGGGVLANGPMGARDAECEWSGWGTVTAFSGAEDAREIPGRAGMYLSVPGRTSLSPGLNPGTRIEFRPSPSMALRMDGARVYWSDEALNPAPDETGGGADVAAIGTFSPYGGRIAWFGFRLDQPATPRDSARAHRMVRNGVAWAAGVPTAHPSVWPGARQAAAMFVLDVEAEPENALATAAMLESRSLPGTFFAVSGLVEDDGELAESLTAVGEVGTQTIDHMPLANLTAQDQRSRLRRSATDIEQWTGIPPVGLHPPEEAHDSLTVDAWLRAGGTYLLARNGYRSGSPERHETEAGVGILLPRLVKDDYNIIVQDRVLRSNGLRDAYLAGVRKMRAIGGLAVVAGHTQILRPGQRVNAVGAVADTMTANGDWWIATGGDVARWWSGRAETRVGFAPPEAAAGDSAVVPPAPTLGPGVTNAGEIVSDIFVTAPAATSLEALWIDVVLPEFPEGLVPLVNGEAVDFRSTQWGMQIPILGIAPGETRRVGFVILGPDASGTDPGS